MMEQCESYQDVPFNPTTDLDLSIGIDDLLNPEVEGGEGSPLVEHDEDAGQETSPSPETRGSSQLPAELSEGYHLCLEMLYWNFKIQNLLRHTYFNFQETNPMMCPSQE